jgi:hypothetical protein
VPLGDYLLVAPFHRELSVLCPIRWKADGRQAVSIRPRDRQEIHGRIASKAKGACR